MRDRRPIRWGPILTIGLFVLGSGVLVARILRHAAAPSTVKVSETEHLYLTISFDRHTGLDQYLPANFTPRRMSPSSSRFRTTITARARFPPPSPEHPGPSAEPTSSRTRRERGFRGLGSRGPGRAHLHVGFRAVKLGGFGSRSPVSDAQSHELHRPPHGCRTVHFALHGSLRHGGNGHSWLHDWNDCLGGTIPRLT
jgi:hypothetical protein